MKGYHIRKMKNELKNLLIKEYGKDDAAFINGIPAMLSNDSEVKDVMEFINTEHPSKSKVVLLAVHHHRKINKRK